MNKIVCGDTLEILKTLDPESVNCIVTSPPYFGLRDYGTAKWDGGNENCDHKEAKLKSRYDYAMPASAQYGTHKGMKDGTDQAKWKDICPACGAVKIDNQIGMEKTLEEYVGKLVEVFRQANRVLRGDGTVFLNLGDSYNGYPGGVTRGEMLSGRNQHARHFKETGYGLTCESLKPKDLIGIPWRVALALQADGWWLRQDIIWSKPNPMPESVTDRCTKSHEYIFLLSKSAKYYFDNEAIREPINPNNTGSIRAPKMGANRLTNSRDMNEVVYDEIKGANKRSVWTVPTNPYPDAHFATFPEDLVIPCIKAGSPRGGLVMDPFSGAGTTCMVAKKLERRYLGIELNPKYVEMSERRIETECGTLF